LTSDNVNGIGLCIFKIENFQFSPVKRCLGVLPGVSLLAEKGNDGLKGKGKLNPIL